MVVGRVRRPRRTAGSFERNFRKSSPPGRVALTAHAV
ncbi:MAG: hypothetical protein RLZZ188_1001, partial [Verrucomicrobiota bacterium]